MTRLFSLQVCIDGSSSVSSFTRAISARYAWSSTISLFGLRDEVTEVRSGGVGTGVVGRLFVLLEYSHILLLGLVAVRLTAPHVDGCTACRLVLNCCIFFLIYLPSVYPPLRRIRVLMDTTNVLQDSLSP